MSLGHVLLLFGTVLRRGEILCSFILLLRLQFPGIKFLLAFYSGAIVGAVFFASKPMLFRH